MSTGVNHNPVAEHRPSAPLEYTGERMVPEVADRFTFWEHVYRYAFACRFVPGKRVLDIACGEGYGTAALGRAGAQSVVGVDVSSEACIHAKARYAVDARLGDAESIPLPDASVDVVVSFETIEHVSSPPRFLAECARVLVRGGTLIVSTPNKDVYSAPGTAPNPFHCSEMTKREFLSALRERFVRIRLHTQHPRSASRWTFRYLATSMKPVATGLDRFRRSAQFRFFPRAVFDPTDAERNAVVEQIVGASLQPTNPLNP
ncbi:MAG TPA: class I SAM-dependent methyltransferase, partial [Candidatus Acidoferrales bacterium]|nr:class I SAM-dependent methyltransferase [Candidatus Acidoferrales bacterium]